MTENVFSSDIKNEPEQFHYQYYICEDKYIFRWPYKNSQKNYLPCYIIHSDSKGNLLEAKKIRKRQDKCRKSTILEWTNIFLCEIIMQFISIGIILATIGSTIPLSVYLSVMIVRIKDL